MFSELKSASVTRSFSSKLPSMKGICFQSASPESKNKSERRAHRNMFSKFYRSEGFNLLDDRGEQIFLHVLLQGCTLAQHTTFLHPCHQTAPSCHPRGPTGISQSYPAPGQWSSWMFRTVPKYLFMSDHGNDNQSWKRSWTKKY